MAQRVVLHVGVMKSGTTSLQALLVARRDELADQDVLVPGSAWTDQVRAVRDLLTPSGTPRPSWAALVAEVEAWPGTAVVSMEYLGTFRESQVAEAVSSFAPTPVEVVVTVRDLNRSLVSMWQETVQNGRSWSWPDYLAGARQARPRRGLDPATRSEAGRTFWRQQDVVRIVRRWGAAVGPENVTVVTVPWSGGDRNALLVRFARAVGFDPAGLAAPPSANASVGAASAVMLHRLNAVLDDAGTASAAERTVRKEVLAKTVLAPRAGDEPRLGLRISWWVRRQSARMLRDLRRTGCRLEGSWSDLVPADAVGIDPQRVSEADIAAAAHAGRVGLAAELGHPAPESAPESAPSDAASEIAALAALIRPAGTETGTGRIAP